MEPLVEIWFDGACAPKNPGGHLGWGFLAEANGKIIHKQSGYMPAKSDNTNNMAEYLALLDALIWAYKSEAKNLLIYGDSKLVIEQMSGRWRMNGGAYIKIASRCKNALKFFDRIKFQWIPREENEDADELSNEQFVQRGIKFFNKNN